jgi:hypothetical protein
LPADSITAAAGRAAQGQLPAGAALNRVVVSGLAVGIDLDSHTLQIIDPSVREIHTVSVQDHQCQKKIAQVKVGDEITTYITEALLDSIDPV